MTTHQTTTPSAATPSAATPSAATPSAATPLATSLAARLRDARRARAERRALVRELSDYTAPHEVDDILALISGRDDADAEQVRSILTWNSQHAAVPTRLAS